MAYRVGVEFPEMVKLLHFYTEFLASPNFYTFTFLTAFFAQGDGAQGGAGVVTDMEGMSSARTPTFLLGIHQKHHKKKSGAHGNHW